MCDYTCTISGHQLPCHTLHQLFQELGINGHVMHCIQRELIFGEKWASIAYSAALDIKICSAGSDLLIV